MSTHRSVRLPLAGALALALFGVAGVAAAQTTMPQPPPPPPPPTTTTMPAQPAQPMPAPPQQTAPQQQTMPPQTPPSQSATPQQPANSGQFYQGTESTAHYPLPDSNGGTLTVNSGMPENAKDYGPPPPFATLDTNHDGRISETEAQAYPPLDSDFLYASGQGKTISRAQYEKWVQNQH